MICLTRNKHFKKPGKYFHDFRWIRIRVKECMRLNNIFWKITGEDLIWLINLSSGQTQIPNFIRFQLNICCHSKLGGYEISFYKKYRITKHQNKEDRKWLWVMISYQTTTWPSQGRSISIQTELTWYGCNAHSAQIYIQFSADEHNIKYYTYIDEVTLNGVARVKHRWTYKNLNTL